MTQSNDIEGAFDNLSDKQKDIVMTMVGKFHCRNGVKQQDGSMGEIRITPKQMNDCLAAMLLSQNESLKGWSGCAWKDGEYVDDIQEHFDRISASQWDPANNN